MDMTPRLPDITVAGLTKSYCGYAQPVLEDVSLSLCKGEIVALIGRSGCGKTTLLHCLAGLLEVDRGAIAPEGLARKCAVVFQDHRLLPWASLEANLLLALRSRQDLSKADRKDRVSSMLRSLGLAGFAASKPNALSGGMAQRAALGRALLQEPNLLLLDEPFASLDALTRIEMHDLLLELHQAKPRTTLFVTHDLEEAVKLADRVLVMANGTLIQDRSISHMRPRDLDDPDLRLIQQHLRAFVTEHSDQGTRYSSLKIPGEPNPC